MPLVRITLNSYDPLNPIGNIPAISAESPAYGVILPASNGTIEAFDSRILEDPAQRRNFRYVILSAAGLTFTPQALDILRASEGLFRILGVTPLNPAGDGAIIYNVGCTLDTQLTLGVTPLANEEGVTLVLDDQN